MNYYLGAIWSYGFNFNPRGTMKCDGQILAISQNDALFALIGTIYGGDGVTTFALPDLRGRVPIGTGTGPGLPSYVIGQAGGSENVTLTNANLPPHNHAVVAVSTQVSAAVGGANNPNAAYFAVPSPSQNIFSTTSNGLMASNTGATGATGGSQPLSILSPLLVINYCIATEGIFPSRN